MVRSDWFILKSDTLRKESKYRVFFWSVFSPNTGKYGPEKTPYLDTFQAVQKTSNYLAEYYLFFTDGLLELPVLDEIKLYLVLFKTYLADIWFFRKKILSSF